MVMLQVDNDIFINLNNVIRVSRYEGSNFKGIRVSFIDGSDDEYDNYSFDRFVNQLKLNRDRK